MRKNGLTGDLIPENDAERTDPRYLAQERQRKAEKAAERERQLYGPASEGTRMLRDAPMSSDAETERFLAGVVRAELRDRQEAQPDWQVEEMKHWLREQAE